ncbi:integrase_H2C2 domain-containing protein [Nephila pilipes]|uniref:Integrase_H2C2 domain-containing protein n=1 Tax=Nephila pilipes TaxID=299642 RepID=A0A8X6MJJ7_NEPPI|nr:integrase_H2C2 domain-containing protein [Nephila pilipes]
MAGSQIWNLAPYLQDGLLRVKGCLDQSELTGEEKLPTLLPRSKYTNLLILREHNELFSSGITDTLCRLRERFWSPKSRELVKCVLKSCLVPRKYSAKYARLGNCLETGTVTMVGRLVTLEELSAILTEILSLINNRPTSYDCDDMSKRRALIPSHFLLPNHRDG